MTPYQNNKIVTHLEREILEIKIEYFSYISLTPSPKC